MPERDDVTALSARFRDAVAFAVGLHAGQFRKGTGIPYVSHLFAVAGLALEHGGTEDEGIAALLHDAAEDQGGRPTLDVIRHWFGDAVAAIVDGCTDTVENPKPDWRPRKEAYVAHVRTAGRSVRLVSCCDKLHNARCILADARVLGDAVFARFTGGKAGTLWYYRALADAFAADVGVATVPRALADELARTVADLVSRTVNPLHNHCAFRAAR